MATVVPAWNLADAKVGDTVHLLYKIDGRGNGSYHTSNDPATNTYCGKKITTDKRVLPTCTPRRREEATCLMCKRNLRISY